MIQTLTFTSLRKAAIAESHINTTKYNVDLDEFIDQQRAEDALKMGLKIKSVFMCFCNPKLKGGDLYEKDID